MLWQFTTKLDLVCRVIFSKKQTKSYTSRTFVEDAYFSIVTLWNPLRTPQHISTTEMWTSGGCRLYWNPMVAAGVKTRAGVLYSRVTLLSFHSCRNVFLLLDPRSAVHTQQHRTLISQCSSSTSQEASCWAVHASTWWVHTGRVREVTWRTKVDAGMGALVRHSTDSVTICFSLQSVLRIDATFCLFYM